MFDFPNEAYTKNRNPKKFIYEYITNMTTYIKKLYPNLSEENIKSKLKEIISSNIKSPTVYFTKKLDTVDTELDHMPLIEFTNLIKDNITTSSGSIFCKPEKEVSFFTDYIKPKKEERTRVKSEMMQFEEDGNFYDSLLKFYEQLTIKTGINAISGSMCSNIFFKSINCYNSITSSVRHNIMLGYAFIEKIIMSNMYFENEDDAINYVINNLNIFPGEEKISSICKRYKLKSISTNDIKKYLCNCIHIQHIENRNFDHLDKLLDSLTEYEKNFIYYAQGFQNLIWTNEDIFKPIFENILSISYDINEIMKDKKYNNEESVYSLPDNQLLTFIFILSHHSFNGQTIKEIDKNDKEVKAIIKYIYYKVESKLKYFTDLFNTFMFIDINLHKPFKHTNMIRKTVILSDTDSIIFTTIKWIYWFTNKIVVNQKSINFHSLLIYFCSKFLDHAFCLFCRETNVATKDLRVVNIKNEFFFSSFLRTGISKHYGALMRIQEGVVLPKPKLEIKGKNIKGSDLSLDTRKVLKDFIKTILYSIEENPNLDFSKILQIVIDHELYIYNNLRNRNTNFLIQKPIKDKSEYKIPYSSNWFYYHLWQSVFASTYGDIIIPQKCKAISLKLKLNPDNIFSIKYMKDINQKIYDAFKKFIYKYKEKNITQIIFPPNIKIPKEILPLIDYKKIINSQCYGIYLMLRSFNIGPINLSKDERFLLSELYMGKNFS